MNDLLLEVTKSNDCHNSSDGKFCSTGVHGTGGAKVPGTVDKIPVDSKLMADPKFKEAYSFVHENYKELLFENVRFDKRNFVPTSKFNNVLANTTIKGSGEQTRALISIREKQSSAEFVDTMVHELTHVKQARGVKPMGGSTRLLSGSDYSAYRSNWAEQEAWAAGAAAKQKFKEYKKAPK